MKSAVAITRDDLTLTTVRTTAESVSMGSYGCLPYLRNMMRSGQIQHSQPDQWTVVEQAASTCGGSRWGGCRMTQTRWREGVSDVVALPWHMPFPAGDADCEFFTVCEAGWDGMILGWDDYSGRAGSIWSAHERRVVWLISIEQKNSTNAGRVEE
jgi:hypothetical protein